ncbi:MAG: hypothetical protein HYZ12_06335, partial [Thaumarchaeota archaeon]|nr:hypothetical protein [Nitrososphaerota archaeon]
MGEADVPDVPEHLHRDGPRLTGTGARRRRVRMGLLSSIRAGVFATWSGIRHLFRPRMTLKYPEQKLDLEGPGYKYDPRKGVGLPGFKGRHILYLDKCTGCQLCAIACDGVAVAIEMQFVQKNKPHNKKDIWPAVDYGRCVFCALCIDPLTPVVTNPSLKQMEEISVGDMVLTHSGVYRPVTKVWDMSYTGPLYKVSVYGKPEPLVCTQDHPILAVSRPISKRKDRRLLRVTEPLKFFKPGELKPGDYMVSPIVKKEVPVKVYEKEVPLYKFGLVKRRQVLSATPDLFRLIGYYLAEGSCDGGRRISFDFNVTETDTLVEDCRLLIKSFFGKGTVLRKNGRNGVRLVLHSAEAEDFFSQFGKGAPNKHLPEWTFFAEKEKLLELVKGEWLGDGCKIRQPKQKYLNIVTTSRTLAFQLQQILAKLGIVATLECSHQRERLPSYHVDVFGRWAIQLARMWNISFDFTPSKHTDRFLLTENYVFMPIRKIETSLVADYRVM